MFREAEMYQADEGTGSMEDGAVRLWVVPVEPHGTLFGVPFTFLGTDEQNERAMAGLNATLGVPPKEEAR